MHSYGSDLDQLKRVQERFVSSFSTDPKMLAFANHFCIDSGENSIEMATYCTRVLYDCLTNDKPEMIPVYIWIYQSLTTLYEGTIDFQTAMNLKLFIQYYSNREANLHERLVDISFVSLINFKINQFWIELLSFSHPNAYSFRKFLQTYLIMGVKAFSGICPLQKRLIIAYLVFNCWPMPSQIMSISEIIFSGCDASASLEINGPILAVKGLFPGLSFSSIKTIVSLLLNETNVMKSNVAN
jgi:hypothetical protein